MFLEISKSLVADPAFWVVSLFSGYFFLFIPSGFIALISVLGYRVFTNDELA
jgi:hypothetical protein